MFCSIRRGQECGKLQLDMDMTKQLLSSKGVMHALMGADLPVYLHFGWHMTCEEINRIARLQLKVSSSSSTVHFLSYALQTGVRDQVVLQGAAGQHQRVDGSNLC